MKHFIFTVYLGADGETRDEAWNRAVEAFNEDPGEPDRYTEEEIEEDETRG